MHNPLLADGINKESYYEEEDNEKIVICHLHMVGIYLKCSEDACYYKAWNIFAFVC